MNDTMRITQDKKVVYIHLKTNVAKLARMVGNIELEVIHNKEKIGSVYKSNGSILRGLNKHEEKLYLPRILGISKEDVHKKVELKLQKKLSVTKDGKKVLLAKLT